MRKATMALGLGVLFASFLTGAASQESEDILTNEDIMTMSAGGVPRFVIMTKIRSSHSEFDTSADAMVELSQAGVEESVMVDMIQASSTETSCAE